MTLFFRLVEFDLADFNRIPIANLSFFEHRIALNRALILIWCACSTVSRYLPESIFLVYSVFLGVGLGLEILLVDVDGVGDWSTIHSKMQSEYQNTNNTSNNSCVSERFDIFF